MRVIAEGWIHLVQEEGGPRYYVNDEPLHAGVGIEVQIDGRGAWIAGRYEYSWPGRGKPIVPFFYHGPDDGPDQVHTLDPERDRVRVSR